jgi:hypothetical protein
MKALWLGAGVLFTLPSPHDSCMQAGIDDGAVLLTGGRRPPSCPKGYFIEPTVFIKVGPNMRIWKEEIFGPVLSGISICQPCAVVLTDAPGMVGRGGFLSNMRDYSLTC